MNSLAAKTGGVRFAPSPTGRFHIGNIRTAWISWLIARNLKIEWVVRFEDIDQPRVVPGAVEDQLADMKALGLISPRVSLQSENHRRHWELFSRGVREGMIYPCTCSRKDVQAAIEGLASAPHRKQPFYSGRCRGLPLHRDESVPTIGWRFRESDPTGQDDFIVARTLPKSGAGSSRLEPDAASFVPAYHWACAIDDHDSRVDLIVRAHDLGPAISAQRAIQAWIASREEAPPQFPAVFHTSLVVDNQGHRLEKRTRGVTLNELFKEGWTAETILELFSRSFDPSLIRNKPAPGTVLGELSETLTLSALGF